MPFKRPACLWRRHPPNMVSVGDSLRCFAAKLGWQRPEKESRGRFFWGVRALVNWMNPLNSIPKFLAILANRVRRRESLVVMPRSREEQWGQAIPVWVGDVFHVPQSHLFRTQPSVAREVVALEAGGSAMNEFFGVRNLDWETGRFPTNVMRRVAKTAQLLVSDPDEFVIGVFPGGRGSSVLEGHHRLAVQTLRGRKTSKVEVVADMILWPRENP